VAVYGPGDHIGELALLEGGPRTADVTAGDDGVVGVVVKEADLLSILEERPKAGLIVIRSPTSCGSAIPIRSDDVGKRGVEQVTGFPFAFELAAA